MAEIKIEKKTPVWPWVILGVAIIAALLYFFAFDDGDNVGTQEERSEQSIGETANGNGLNNATVAAYVSYIRNDPDQMGLDHEYTNEALLKLSKATNAMADAVGHDIQRDMEVVRTQANKITTDPFESTHANAIRQSADILASVLKRMQQQAHPGMDAEATALKDAAAAIDPDVLTLDQKGDVKNFFREAANLLDKMNSTPPQI